ncbi:MAG TPA: alpha/beta hydrolase [Acidimicrobiia bacterium]
MVDTAVMELPDGRELAWIELGNPDGAPVVVLHGTPGSRYQVASRVEPIVAAGIRFIALDRPGYGHSSYHARQRLADAATDVACLAEHLGIERFAILGYSGGGPYAAACAHFLPDRVRTAGLVSCVGLLAEPGSEAGMMGINRLVSRLARLSQQAAYPAFAFSTWYCRRWPEQSLASAAHQIPPCDLEVLNQPDIRAATLREFQRSTLGSAAAAAQDFALFSRDWGFRLEDISVPVHVWQGDADRNVPAAHARLLARSIPNAQLHECPGEGHMLIFDRLEDILRTLTAIDT